MESVGEETKRKIKITYDKDFSFHEIPSNRKVPKENNVGQIQFKNELKRKAQNISKQNKSQLNLKTLLTQKKADIMAKSFVQKLRLNAVNRKPAEEDLEKIQSQGEEDDFLQNLEHKNGIKLGNFSLTCWAVVNIFHSILMVFILSIMIPFPEIAEEELFQTLQICSIVLFLFDIFLNFIVERYEGGKQLTSLKQIGRYYLGKEFIVDFICLLIILIDLLIKKNRVIKLFTTLVSVFRFFKNKKQLQKLEYLFIDSTEKEQYYGLIKVFLLNFAIGHILSICLNLMAYLSSQNNWWIKLNIVEADWFAKYTWGYYWGTNIMLTVGFGDLSATNQYEAIVLVFIETFSCITLAYNISSVGQLIGLISEKDEEKRKKLKFFHKMCQQNQIPKDLESKITNHIQESYEIKEAFCYDEYDQVLESLPNNLHTEYQKEANKVLFDGMGFLNNLSRRSFLKMAQLVQRKICHPNEFLFKKGEKSQFVILQKGKLCFSCKSSSAKSTLNGKVIDTLSVLKDQKPKVVSLDFIRNKQLQHDIKSEGYSIIYTLSLEKLKESLKAYGIDYEFYCLLRDREQCLLDEQNIYLCQVCKNKYHSKFQCSKLHFKPIKQIVILKQIKNFKSSKCSRQIFEREKPIINTLINLKQVKKDQNKFTDNCLSDEQRLKIQRDNQYNKILQKKIQEKSALSFFEFQQNNKNQISAIFDKFEEVINQNLVKRDFWEVQSDKAWNYRYYFRQNNPNNIKGSNQKNEKNFIDYFKR